MASSPLFLFISFCLFSYQSLISHAAFDSIIRQDVYDGGGDHDYGDDPEFSHRKHHDSREHEEPEHHQPHRKGTEYIPFVLDKPSTTVRTEAGEIRMLPKELSYSLLRKNYIGIKFITLEPKALLLPQYNGADCVFLVNKGTTRLSFVDNNDLQEMELKLGDIYRIKGGAVFHLYNPDEGERAHIFTIFRNSKALEEGALQSFFIAGGYDPKTILSGFDDNVIATAMKVSREEVRDFLNHQNKGPIIYSSLNTTKKEPKRPWQYRSMMSKFLSIFTENPENPYNIFTKSPDFENNYGRTITVNAEDFDMLRKADLTAFAVSLKTGAMLAPHWNPIAAEIGLVTNGEGVIQIAFSNGTNALNEKVGVGSVFFVPQYHPMCQIASSRGPFEFIGFSTSARNNHPQFLAGSNSVFKAMNRDILESAFDTSSDRLTDFLDGQQDAVVLPGRVEKL